MINNPELIEETINNIKKIKKEELESVIEEIKLEEAKKILKEIQKVSIENDKKAVQVGLKPKYMAWNKAIETVLEELNNSISKDKTKEKLNTVKDRMAYLRKEITKTLNEEAGTEIEIDINEQYICNMEIELERLETISKVLEELLEDK